MSSDQLQKLLEDLTDHARVLKIYITGGEPLMRPGFFQMLRFLKQRNVPVTLFTNAILVTPDVADRLAHETSVISVGVSVDGSCPGVHDAFRGKGTFRKTVEGIHALVKAGIRPSAACVVNRLNSRDLSGIARLTINLGCTSISFVRAALVGRALRNVSLLTFSKAEWDRIFDEVSGLQKEVRQVSGGEILEWPKKLAASHEQLRNSSGPGQAVAFCGICKEDVTITPDGWMVPCNRLWNYKIGNVCERDVLALYHSAKARAVRDLFSLTSAQLDGCRHCPFAAHCSGGCRADAYAATGSLMGIDPFRCLSHYLRLRPDQDPISGRTVTA